MKKYIKYIIIFAIIVGLFFTKGNLFELINVAITLPIANILYMIYNLIGDFGLAIIIFTILVKLCMWPLTKNQLRQTRLMKKLQPELNQIRKNCNGNKQLESLQTMDLYKRYNFKPLGSIVILLVQLPIFIALYSAIRVMVLPTPTDNLENRTYSFVQYEGSHIAEAVNLQRPYLSDLENTEIPVEEKTAYDFHPKFLNIFPLDGVASGVLKGEFSTGIIFALFCVIAASITQYLVTKQQQPSNKSKKSKKFRDLLKEAEKNDGDIDQSEITAMTTESMNKIMPIMLFFIMFNLPSALVFYYLLSNLFALVQQKIIFAKSAEEMDDATDKAILKELNAKEAKVIKNKKTGTKITRISAKDNKKKRR